VIKVTLDTCVLPAEDLVLASRQFDCEFAVVTVTTRELDTPYQVHLMPYSTVPETAVWGESRWDEAVWGSEVSQPILEEVLRVISPGSFPRDRDNLSRGQLHQLRAAMILETHIRQQRDILVTDDRRAFVKCGKREELMMRFGVRVMLRADFLGGCSAGTLTPI
jgi:hypothetical protein